MKFTEICLADIKAEKEEGRVFPKDLLTSHKFKHPKDLVGWTQEQWDEHLKSRYEMSVCPMKMKRYNPKD